MILKRDLLMGIDANTEQLAWQGQLILELKERIEKLEKSMANRTPGRPKKVCDLSDKVTQCPGVKRAKEILEEELSKVIIQLAKMK